MRYAMFDIETTGLEASYGRLLCASFKFNDKKRPVTYRAPRYEDEPLALAQIAQAFDTLDFVVTWNGKLFDIPFVNARLMIRKPHGARPILNPTIKHVDLRWTAVKLRTRGHRLEGMSVDLGTRMRKYDVPAESWVKAAGGDARSLASIVKHCECDVEITEEMFEKLQPYIVRITR